MDRISYIKIGISIAIILMGVYLVYPLLSGLIAGFVLSYAFLPVYHFLFAKTKRKSLSAWLTTLFVSAPILLTLLYVTIKAVRELDTVSEILSGRSVTSVLHLLGIDLTQFPFYDFITENIPPIVDFSQIFSRTLDNLPLTFMNLAVLFLSIYYFLSEREKIDEYVCKIMPSLYRKDLLEILEPTRKIINGLIYGNIMTAFVTGFLATIGFIVLGVPYASLLGILVGIFALLPVNGPLIVFIIVGIYYLIIGELFRGAALLLYGVAFLGVLYQIYISPKFGKNQSQLHPFIVLLGFLGGLYVMGPIGLLYGPIILGLLKGVSETIFKEATTKRRFFRW